MAFTHIFFTDTCSRLFLREGRFSRDFQEPLLTWYTSVHYIEVQPGISNSSFSEWWWGTVPQTALHNRTSKVVVTSGGGGKNLTSRLFCFLSLMFSFIFPQTLQVWPAWMMDQALNLSSGVLIAGAPWHYAVGLVCQERQAHTWHAWISTTCQGYMSM